MQSDKLQDQIIESIYSPELNEIDYDIPELVFDALLDDGILKALPVIGTIVKIFKSAMDIRDRLFVAKVARFLFQLSRVPLEYRQSFQKKVHQDAKLKRKLGQALVLLLDRLDDMQKPEFVAKCFGEYLSGTISYELFRRLSAAIDMAFVEDLKAICQDDIDLEGEGRIYLANLSKTGLVDLRASGIEGTWEEMGVMKYSLSSLGRRLVEIIKSQPQ